MTVMAGLSRDVPPSHAQNRNRHRANDSVAVGPQVTAIRVAPGNQQVRLRLLGSLAQHLGHVTTADEHIGLDARVLLELCHLLGSVADELLFPPLIDVAAPGPQNSTLAVTLASVR